MSEIRTRTVTPEYEAGFDRIYGGPRAQRPGRARYVWDAQASRLVEVGSDWEPQDRRVPVVGDAHYDGLRSPVDGADISSRTKHRNYMKATGLALADDYKGEWAQAEKRRERVLAGDFDRKERRDAIGRAIYDAQRRKH